MKDKLHFAESAKEVRRQEERLGNDVKLAQNEPTPASEPVRTTEDTIPARDRWRKRLPRKFKK